MADQGWTAELLFSRGELYRARGRPEDLDQAATFYRQAIQSPDAPPEAYRGLTRDKARAKVLEDLKAQGLLGEVKDYKHQVGHCYRCHTVVGGDVRAAVRHRARTSGWRATTSVMTTPNGTSPVMSQ